MFKRISESIEMSFDIPDSEKEQAREAKMYFEACINSLHFAVEHLDHIYEPFKEHIDVSVESVVQNRGVLQGRFSSKIKENFNKAKAYGVMAIRKLNVFSTGDTDIREIVNSFIESVESVEEQVSNFLNILKNDYESEDFRIKVLSTIDVVKKETSQLEELVYDRIINHIDTNILTKNWMNETEDQLNMEDAEQLPLVTELFNERNKELNPDSFPSVDVQNQSLNPSDAQQMLNPNFVRFKNFVEFGE